MWQTLLSNKLKNTDIGLLVLRLFGGVFMLSHGIPKLIKIMDGDFAFPDPLGIGSAGSLVLAVMAEFFCALALLLGFKVRLASIPLMITMLVAAFIVHGDDPWGKKEFPLLYFAIYLAIFLMGAGNLSIDKNKGSSK